MTGPLDPLTSAEQLRLLERIADRLAYPGCSRSFDGQTWRFAAETSDGLYRRAFEVVLPLPGEDYVVRSNGAPVAVVSARGALRTPAGDVPLL